ANAYQQLDASKLSPTEIAQRKQAILAPLNPANRVQVENHLNDVLEARSAYQDAKKQTVGQVPGPSHPDLAPEKMNTMELAGELNGTNPTTSAPGDPNPKFGRFSKEEVKAEYDRRLQLLQAQKDLSDRTDA